jgi:hypothetical protein
MNTRGHLVISLIKSVIRMIACLIAVIGSLSIIWVLPVGFFIAEMLGVAEELVL